MKANANIPSLEDTVTMTYSALATRRDRAAFIAAWKFKWKNWPEVAESLRRNSYPIFLRCVADALDSIEGRSGTKGYFRSPTPTCLNVVKSYWAAVSARDKEVFGNSEGLLKPGDVDPTIPELWEIKQQFVRSFRKDLLPADSSIRRILTSLHLKWRKTKGGRPKKLALK